MKKHYFLSFFLSLFILISFAQVEVKYKNYDDLLFQAEDAFYSENYGKALVYFDTLSRIDTAQFNYYSYHIGLCYLYSNIDNNKILEYLEPATQNLDGTFLIDLVYFNLGKAYQLFYRFDDAIDAYQKSLELDKTEGSIEFTTLVKKQINMCRAGIELMKKTSNVKISNLGKRLNSVYPDYQPVITNDEYSLIFTSRRDINKGGELDKTGKYYEDIFITNRNDFGNWNEPRLISDTINTNRHEASIELLDNGNTLLLYKGSGSKNGLFTSRFDGSKWLPPEIVNAGINSQFKASAASISADNQTMYFVSDRKGGIGGKDIYKMEKNPDGSWADPLNLGNKINTPEDEESPYVDINGKVLYFSSKGHNSMGGFDIFKSTNQNGDWSVPENMGIPVNTTADDVHFRMTANNRRAYYASSMTGGLGVQDIYQITFSEFNSPYKIIRGKIFSGHSAGGIKIFVTDAEEKSYLRHVFNPDSAGNYILFLQPGKKYEMLVTGSNFYSQKFRIKIPEFNSLNGSGYLPYLNQRIFLKPIHVFGKTIGEECSVVNAFVISEKDAYDSSALRTDTINFDFFNILEELTLSAVDSAIKISENTGGFSNSLNNFPMLSFRKERLTRITDPDLNQINSAIERYTFQNKISNLYFFDENKKVEPVFYSAFNEKFKGLPSGFMKSENFDYGDLPKTIKNLVVNHLVNYFFENGETGFENEGDSVFAEEIAKLIKSQQNIRLIKNQSQEFINSVVSFHLSNLVKIVFQKSFSDEMAGIDSLGLSKIINTGNLGLSQRQVIDLFSTPSIELNNFQISKRIDIQLEITINNWMSSSPGFRSDSSEMADVVKKQIAFMISSQLDKHNKLILMKQKLGQFLSQKIIEIIKSHFDTLDFISVVETDSAELYLQVKNSVEHIASEMNDNSLVRALALSSDELSKMVVSELSMVFRKELESLKLFRIDNEISLSQNSFTSDEKSRMIENRVLLRGTMDNGNGEFNLSSVRITMIDTTTNNMVKFIANPDKSGNYFMLLEGGKTYEMVVSADSLLPEKLMYYVPVVSGYMVPFHSQRIIYKPISVFDETIGQEFSICNLFNVVPDNNADNLDTNSFIHEFNKKYLFLLGDNLQDIADSATLREIQIAENINTFKTAYLTFNSNVIKTSRFYEKILSVSSPETNLLSEIIKKEFFTHGYSNISFYGSGVPENLVLTYLGNDSVFVLPSKFKKTVNFDYNLLAQNLSETVLEILNLQNEKIDPVSLADFCSLVLSDLEKSSIPFTPVNELRSAIISAIENAANISLANLKASGDKSSPAFTLLSIIDIQMDEQKRKLATEQKLAELIRLRVLQKINSEFGKINLLALAEMNDSSFSDLIERELGIPDLNDFPELTEAQKNYLSKINFTGIVEKEIKNASAGFEALKVDKIAEMISESKYQNRIIIRGNIAMSGKIPVDAIVKITLIDRSDNSLVPFVYNPDKDGNYLMFPENGKDYDMVVEAEGLRPQLLRLNLTNAVKLNKLPFLDQQLILKSIDAFNETIGQEILVYNSLEGNLAFNDTSGGNQKNNLTLFMFDILSYTDSLAKVNGYTENRQVYQVANNRSKEHNMKSAKLISGTLSLVENFGKRIEKVYSLGVSNLAIYNSSMDDKLIPVIYGNDTIYTLPEFFKRAANYDYKKLSLLISAMAQKQNPNDIDAEMKKELVAFTYMQLFKNNILNSSLDELNDEKLESVIRPHFLLAINDVKEEENKKREIGKKLSELAKLQILDAIDTKLNTMAASDIAGLDSAKLIGLLGKFITEIDKSNFPGLTPSQIKRISNSLIRDIVADELYSIVGKELEEIKRDKIKRLLMPGDSMDAYTLLRGKISVNSDSLLPPDSKIRIVEQQSGKTIKYVYLNPDGSYFALLNPAMDYNIIVQTGELLPEKIKLDLSRLKALPSLPLYYQHISLVSIDAFDEIIGQQVTVNSSVSNILEDYDSSLAMSNVNIYGIDKKSILMPYGFDNDTVYILPSSYKKPSFHDFRKLSLIISSLKQMEMNDTLNKAGLIALIKESKVYDYKQLEKIISGIELMSEVEIHDKSKWADVVAKTILKLQYLQPEKLKIRELEEIANLKLEEVISEELSGINIQDSSSFAVNKSALIFNAMVSENISRDSILNKFYSLAKLKSLEKINKKIEQMTIAEIASMDSLDLYALMEKEYDNFNISENPEFSVSQKEYINRSKRGHKKLEPERKISLAELEKIKYSQLARHLGQNELSATRVLVSGKISEEGKREISKTNIYVFEKATRIPLTEIYHPDSNGNYFLLLDPAKDYEVIVKKDGFIHEKFSINIHKERELAGLPVIFQEIEIKPVKVYNETIGQEFLVANSKVNISDKYEAPVKSNLNIYTKENLSGEMILLDNDTIFTMPDNFVSVRGKYSHLPQDIYTLLLLNESGNAEPEELKAIIHMAIAEMNVKNSVTYSEQQLKSCVSASIEKRKKQNEAAAKTNILVNSQAKSILSKQISGMSKAELEIISEKAIAEFVIAELKKSNSLSNPNLTREQYDKIIRDECNKLISLQMKNLVESRLAGIYRLELKMADEEYLASVNKVKPNADQAQIFVYKVEPKDTSNAVAMSIPEVSKRIYPIIDSTLSMNREIEKSDSAPIIAERNFIVYFDYDKSNINNQYTEEMEVVISYILALPEYKIEISGHTDSNGSDSYNLILSKKRAEALAKYCTMKGLKRSRIKVFGLGESKPIAPNSLIDGSDNPKGRQKNRRAEIKVRG